MKAHFLPCQKPFIMDALKNSRKFLRLCTDYFYLSTEYRELCEDGGMPEELSNAIKSAFKESLNLILQMI